MDDAIGQAITFGIGVTLTPAAIIAVVFTISSPGGRLRASVFVLCWALTLGAVGTLALLLADGADAREGGEPAAWVIAVQVVLALLLLVVAVWQWRGRGDEVGDELPGWMQKVDGLTASGAAIAAIFLAAAKPKNLLLTIGVAIAIAELGVGAGAQAAGLATFVLLGTLAPAIPLVISVLMGERGSAILTEVRSWMVRENRTIIAVLCLVFAAKLLGDALLGA